MKHCSNPECGYRQRHKTDAEYQDSATTCSDCGAVLVEGGASRPELEKNSAAARQAFGARPWGRLGVSLVCVVIFLVASFTALPGTGDSLRQGRDPGGFLALFNISVSAPQFSVMAVGFNPILLAYMLVELLAVMVPGWRRLRIGGEEGRARLRYYIILVAALLAFVQAVGIANYVRGLAGGGSHLHFGFPAVEPWVPWAAVIVLPLGTLLTALLAAAIDRWGVGNGLSCVLLAVTLPAFLSSVLSALMRSRETSGMNAILLGAIVVVVCVMVSRALARKTPFALEGKPYSMEIPPSGIDPLTGAASILLMPATLGAFIGRSVDLHRLGSFGYSVIELLIVASAGVALSLLYNQPRRVAQVWVGQGASESAVGAIRKQIAGAALRGTGLLLGVTLIKAASPWFNVPMLDLLSLIVATAIALDLGKEFAFRRAHPNLVRVWPLHRVYAAQPVFSALNAMPIG